MPRDKGNNMRALLNNCGITFVYVLFFVCNPRLARDPTGREYDSFGGTLIRQSFQV